MFLRDEEYKPKDPNDAYDSGIGMVFQEQSLLKNLTVAQNIFFCEEKRFKKFGIVNWRAMNAEARKVLDSLGLSNINEKAKVSDIQFSQRQMVEIAKVFNRATKSPSGDSLILLDEPTSVLSSEEIKILFEKVRAMKEKGNSVIFISHRLNEVIDIADRIVVFKDGSSVGELNGKVTEADIFEKMIGKTSAGEFYRESKQGKPGDKTLIKAKELSLHGYFKDIDFEVREGEIVSVYGVVGSGKERLCGVLSGDEKHTAGNLQIDGEVVKLSGPHVALKKGVACIPTERRTEGQVGLASIRENISYSCTEALKNYGLISKKKDDELAKKWIEDLKIKCENCEQPIENLSGGNAQKVVFARVLSTKAKILILNHPTRGVDVGAKEEIYEIIRDATSRGIGVILQGDTLDECIGLSNKILVMKDGLLTKVVEAPANNKPKQIDVMKYMM
jgi:ribose transport system ATP-binding protein